MHQQYVSLTTWGYHPNSYPLTWKMAVWNGLTSVSVVGRCWMAEELGGFSVLSSFHKWDHSSQLLFACVCVPPHKQLMNVLCCLPCSVFPFLSLSPSWRVHPWLQQGPLPRFITVIPFINCIFCSCVCIAFQWQPCGFGAESLWFFHCSLPYFTHCKWPPCHAAAPSGVFWYCRRQNRLCVLLQHT